MQRATKVCKRMTKFRPKHVWKTLLPILHCTREPLLWSAALSLWALIVRVRSEALGASAQATPPHCSCNCGSLREVVSESKLTCLKSDTCCADLAGASACGVRRTCLRGSCHCLFLWSCLCPCLQGVRPRLSCGHVWGRAIALPAFAELACSTFVTF